MLRLSVQLVSIVSLKNSANHTKSPGKNEQMKNKKKQNLEHNQFHEIFNKHSTKTAEKRTRINYEFLRCFSFYQRTHSSVSLSLFVLKQEKTFYNPKNVFFFLLRNLNLENVLAHRVIYFSRSRIQLLLHCFLAQHQHTSESINFQWSFSCL